MSDTAKVKADVTSHQDQSTRRKARRGGRGALFLTAALLALSGILRIGAGASQALANNEPASPEMIQPTTTCEPDAGALTMLAELRSREERLAKREGQIADHSQALALANTEISRKLAALVAAEEKLSGTLAMADAAADKDVARLVAVYEKMKPKDAAPLFAEMNPEFAAGFLARMRPDAAASVMAGLDPKVAYAISVLLAGRNANAPKS
jgi:flagellar motility protein MotE (MotC chaperone)